MKYASTQIVAGNEIVITTLPLSLVPKFNPDSPHPFTYAVADDVQAGWVKQEDGSFIAPTPTSIPSSVTALQALLAIDQAGLSAAYEAWANDPARTFAQRAFINKAQNWRRDDATLGAAAVSLGLSSEQVDALFVLAATL